MTKHIRYVAFLVIVAVLVTACQRVTIAQLKANPGNYRNKEVGLEGKVTSVSFGVLGMGVYEIDDGTGKLYVYTESGGAPTEGAKVGVKGKLVESFTFLGKNYVAILHETGRRSAD